MPNVQNWLFWKFLAMVCGPYPDDIARLWQTDSHVLAALLYCDHQSALAAYGIHPSRLIDRRNHCLFYTGSCGKMAVSAAKLHAMWVAWFSRVCGPRLLSFFYRNVWENNAKLQAFEIGPHVWNPTCYHRHNQGLLAQNIYVALCIVKNSRTYWTHVRFEVDPLCFIAMLNI